MAASFAFAAIVVERGKPSKSRRFFTREGSEFGHADEEGDCGALANARHADQEIEPIGEIGMGAQNSENAFELERAALFEAGDFRFGPGLESGGLKSLAGLVLPRAISSSICSIKVRCSARAAKRGSGGAWSVSTAAVQAAISAASMISFLALCKRNMA